MHFGEIASKDNLRSLLDLLDVGLVKIQFVENDKRNVLWANQGFFALTGATREDYEAESRSGNPRNVLHPDDMEWVFQAFRDHVRTKQKLDIEYRVFHKNGSVVWLHVVSNYLGIEDGWPVFINIMTDITREKLLRDKLEAERKRYTAICSISNESMFQYDVESNTMYNFGNYQEVFDQNEVMPNFTEAICSGFVHSEDVDIVKREVEYHFSALALNETRTSEKFRVKTRRGDYEWYYAIFAPLLDGDGKKKVLGKLVNIHQVTVRMNELRHKSNTDRMTGLLNKVSAEESIQEILGMQADKSHALLLVDVDNFKHINDEFGHAVGDDAILAVAEALRQSFRKFDILGRIGGDEFLVLMQDVHGNSLEQAQQCYTRLTQTLQDQFAVTRMTLSVGMASYPVHATSYEELFRLADEALYRAKKHGKNELCVAKSAET